MRVILNTDELVQRYMAYDSLFSFYENGVKEVVRQAALRSDHRQRTYLSDFHSELGWGASLAGRTVRDWELAVDMALDNSPVSVQDYLQGQNKMDRELIQLVVEHIEEEIDAMIYYLTKDKHYRVAEVPAASAMQWIGNDLIVDISSRRVED